MDRYYVLFDFVGQGDSELTVKSGTQVECINRQVNSGWALCKNIDTSDIGYVPITFIAPVEQSEVAPVVTNGIDSLKFDETSRDMGRASFNPFDEFTDAEYETTAALIPSSKVPAMNSVDSNPHSNPMGSLSRTTLNRAGAVETQSRTFRSTLDFWRERENKFKKGVQNRLPSPETRSYYYWDRKGNRHGPLTEAEMKAKFDKRQLATDTPIKVSCGSVELPQITINDCFPDVEQAFTVAPRIQVADKTLWYYLDSLQQEHGPFDLQRMHSWFESGYFAADTLVKRVGDQMYQKLGIVFPDGVGVFQSRTVPPLPPPKSEVVRASVPHSNSSTASGRRLLARALSSSSLPAAPDGLSSKTNSSTSTQAAGAPLSANTSGTVPRVAIPDPRLTTEDAANYVTSKPMMNSTNYATNPASNLLYENYTNPSGALQVQQHSVMNSTDTIPSSTNSSSTVNVPTMRPPTIPVADDWDIDWEVGGATQSTLERANTSPKEAPRERKSTAVRRKSSMRADSIANPLNVISNETIVKNYLGNVKDLYLFLTRPIPEDLGVIRCRVRRSRIGSNLKYNVFELALEDSTRTDSIGQVLLQATRHSKFGIDSYYEFAFGYSVPSESGTVIAQMLHNTLSGTFVLHNDVKKHNGTAKDLCVMSYSKSGGTGPREMKIGIPGPIGSDARGQKKLANWPHVGGTKKSKLLQALSSYNFTGLTPLVNKQPSWSEKHGAYTLNFNGRVTRASIKNFQLVPLNDNDKVCLLHGRVDADMFVMDVRAPLSPLAAFAICITSNLYH